MRLLSVTVWHTVGARIIQREKQFSLDIKDPDSPFLLGLQKFETESKLSPKSVATTNVLKAALEYLIPALPHLINVPIQKHTRESFDNLLYTIEHLISLNGKSDHYKENAATMVRAILRRVDHPLGDGTFASSCVKDYVTILRTRSFSKRPKMLSAIPHENVPDLENKAKNISKKILDDISRSCEKDLDEYLNVCMKQSKFENYPINISKQNTLYRAFTVKDSNRFLRGIRRIDILKSIFRFIKEHEKSIFSDPQFQMYVPSKKNLNVEGPYRHYLFHKSMHPWFMCQYRLPNHILTSCFLLLLIKTGWNVGSIAHLSQKHITKLANGSYEIQSPKFKTDDETPKVSISKADKYSKICLSLLEWNRLQLIKYGLIPEEKGNLWYGWQEDYEYPHYPVEKYRVKLFFERHNLPKIRPSDIRPLKSSFDYLNNTDLEMIRLALGHTHMDTTLGYLRDNLIYQLNESRILEFQKRLEATIANLTSSETDFSLRGFDKRNVDSNIFSKSHEGTSQFGEDLLVGAKDFLKSLGGAGNEESAIISAQTVTQALLLKRFYFLRWRSLYDKNNEKFVQNHLHVIIYIHVFLRITKERRPSLLNQIKMSLREQEVRYEKTSES